jgi:Type VI secretion system/phage-baseplate injector OB domain
MPDKYFGKYSGIVVDNLDPQNLGQLRVSVPAIFAEDEVVIARPALPYGFFFVPEVGAKLWIEFEGGDPGLPLWTGLQYVPGEWPAEAQASPPKKRVIKTAAGHLVILNDQGGEERIEIKSNTHIVIRCLGTIEIQAPNVIINGRAVVPQPRPI